MESLPKNCLRTFLFLCVAIFAASASAEVVVVVSAASTITRLAPENIAKIFLGKVTTFQNGVNAVPVDQAEGSAIRNEFYAKVARKNSSQLTAYWAKVIFTGDGFPPKQLDGNMAVRKAVANDPNTIGYIEISAVDSSVRVILEP